MYTLRFCGHQMVIQGRTQAGHHFAHVGHVPCVAVHMHASCGESSYRSFRRSASMMMTIDMGQLKRGRQILGC